MCRLTASVRQRSMASGWCRVVWRERVELRPAGKEELQRPGTHAAASSHTDVPPLETGHPTHPRGSTRVTKGCLWDLREDPCREERQGAPEPN
ncbi:hypothetical protein SRHO_G00200380 [Serrasalmus rhombeus]